MLVCQSVSNRYSWMLSVGNQLLPGQTTLAALITCINLHSTDCRLECSRLFWMGLQFGMQKGNVKRRCFLHLTLFMSLICVKYEIQNAFPFKSNTKKIKHVKLIKKHNIPLLHLARFFLSAGPGLGGSFRVAAGSAPCTLLRS